MNRSLKIHNVQLLVTKQRQHCAHVYSHIFLNCDTLIVVAVTNCIYCYKLNHDTMARMCFYNSISPLIPYLHVMKLDKHVSNELELRHPDVLPETAENEINTTVNTSIFINSSRLHVSNLIGSSSGLLFKTSL